MNVSGWGNYPVIDADVQYFRTSAEAQKILQTTPNHILACGLGRSYGDSALNSNLLNATAFNYFLNFNEASGVLDCTSGVCLADILSTFAPRGWFLPVTPGTKYITVGGAIASDVHGKNHHVAGCFSQHVESVTLLLGTGEIVDCSLQQNRELFFATCGGMGLTGIILSAKIKLIKIRSAFVDETTYKTTNLKETLDLIDVTQNTTYSAAWVDGLASGKHMGRGLLMLGEHAGTGSYQHPPARQLSVPFYLPSQTLNRFSIQLFNQLYYSRVSARKTTRCVFYDPFFYPLDGIHHWNRLYGKKGFTQYQFVLPKESSWEGLKAIFQKITASKRGSFLAVLKSTGAANANYLSFPLAGYSLAIDFKIDPSLPSFLDVLDEIVYDYGGRLYLTKDVRMNESFFKKTYPQWEVFQKIRQQYGAMRFCSLQSQRLGLNS